MKTQAIHLDLLYKLCDKLITMQITNPADTNAGALISPNTNPDKTPIHTRAAEAVFPLSVAYKHSQNIKYLESAVRLGNWLIRNQKFNGSWKETPWRWKGTTADQCLAMADAYSILKNQLSLGDQVKWEKTIQKAADWTESSGLDHQRPALWILSTNMRARELQNHQNHCIAGCL